MATVLSKIKAGVDQYIRDTSTSNVTANDRYRAITEAVRQLYNEFEFQFATKTYDFLYLPGISWYNLTTNVPDMVEPTDLTRASGSQYVPFTRKMPRDLLVEIDNPGYGYEPSFAIERRDRKTYLIVNQTRSTHGPVVLSDATSFDGNGTWAADAVAGDAYNVRSDSTEFNYGAGSVAFDIDVTQTAQNRARLYNATLSSVDLSSIDTVGYFLADVYLPAVANFTSVTAYWGSSSTAYWSATATVDYLGNAFVAGWNTIALSWNAASMTSTPDSSALTFVQLDFNYTVSQSSLTGWRINDVRIVQPERMKLVYQTAYIGTTSGGTALTEFTADTDVPFYSGMYDFFDVYAVHQASAALWRQKGDEVAANNQETLAKRELERLKRKFPTTRLTPTKAFRAAGTRGIRLSTRARRFRYPGDSLSH